MLNFIFKKNKNLFNLKKKNILLIIRKSPGEIDWILPILYKFKKKYNIITLFQNKNLFKNLTKKKDLFYHWNNISSLYTFHPPLRYLHLRLLVKLTGFINLYLKRKLLNYSNNLFYDYENFLNQIKKTIKFKKSLYLKFDLLFVGMHNNSFWPAKIKNHNQDIKIIAFPENISIKYNTKNKRHKIQLNDKLLLIHSYDHLKSLKKKFSFKNYLIVNFPKFSKEWINYNLLKIKNKISDEILIIYKGFDNKFFDKIKYDNQLNMIVLFAKKNKLKLLFNIHPYSDKTYLINLLQKINEKFILISNKSLNDDIINHDKILNIYGSNSILDCLAYKKKIFELWKIDKTKEKTRYSKFSTYIKNYYQLNKIFNKQKLKVQKIKSNNKKYNLFNIYKNIIK